MTNVFDQYTQDKHAILQHVERFRKWENDVRTTFAKYQRLKQPVPPDELQRLMESCPGNPHHPKR